MDDVCPDCKMPVSAHQLCPGGRCPVVRVPWPGPPGATLDELWSWARGTLEFAPE